MHERILHFLASIFDLEVEGNYFFNHKNCESIPWLFVVGVFFNGSQGLTKYILKKNFKSTF